MQTEKHGWATVLALGALIAWDVTGWDVPAAAWFGSARGFELRDHWLLTTVLHDGARYLGWALVLALCVGAVLPFGPLRRLPASRRLQLALTPFAGALLVSTIKATSASSCPWDMHDFGGIAQHVSHWQWRLPDGGSGHCFPAGHATVGFSFIGGYFVYLTQPHIARRWLFGALLAGALFGLAQQIRGAHYLSHTLWSGWLCWTVAWLGNIYHQRLAGGRHAHA
jgi:membrane-associated PAP2 superfamily phosphatase